MTESSDLTAHVDIEQLRKDWVGKIFQEYEFYADPARTLEWAVAAGETDPRFIDPEHPDYQVSTGFPTHVNIGRMLPDDFPQFGSGRGIDGGKSIEWHQPMRVGARLAADVQIADIYAKTGRSGTMVFIVNRTTFRDPEGNAVATVDWRSIRQE